MDAALEIRGGLFCCVQAMRERGGDTQSGGGSGKFADGGAAGEG
jgi:hypothetical protein